MKEIVCLLTGIMFILGVVFMHIHTSEAASVGIGTYQCARCGLIMRVRTSGSSLPDRDFYNDGHYHDWRYIGGLSGTIHPIR